MFTVSPGFTSFLSTFRLLKSNSGGVISTLLLVLVISILSYKPSYAYNPVALEDTTTIAIKL